jgi:hypothetical protein
MKWCSNVADASRIALARYPLYLFYWYKSTNTDRFGGTGQQLAFAVRCSRRHSATVSLLSLARALSLSLSFSRSLARSLYLSLSLSPSLSLSNCPLLEVLHASFCHSLTDKGLLAVLQKCKHLTTLDLEVLVA